MKTTREKTDKFEQLRKQAEKLVRQEHGKTREIPSDMNELIHELRVYQAELEIQNEELKKSQQELSDLYYKYEDLYESAPSGYITLNARGEISNINKSASNMLGIRKRHLIENNFTDFIKHPWIDPFITIQQKSGQTGENQEIELPLKNSLKSNNWVHINIIADRNNKSEVKTWKLTLVDITTRKNYEKELIEAKEKANESDQLKSTFLANMSHEIRTPLNGIMGFAELLKNESFSGSKKAQFINTIILSGKHLLDIVNDLIDISKIETGHVETYHSKININEQLNSLYTFFKPETDKKGLKLSCHTPLPAMKANITIDEEKLQSVWINLIKNAIKFTKKGHIQFGYQLENNMLNCYVEDTGIGMTPKEQNSVFNHFVQVEQKTSKSQKGTGLGLSISKAYIELLGGEISLYSAKGKGSRFSFTIPYEPAEKENQEEPVVKDSVSCKGKKILVVEDDVSSQEYMKAILEPEGAEVIIAETGEQGIKEIQNHTDFDLVLIDIGLPDMTGLKVIQKIKQINNQILVITQTAYAMSEDRNKCINAGADDYIAKPIDKKDLLQVIRKHINC